MAESRLIMKDFESYLVNKNDDIDNLSYELIKAFVRKDFDKEIDWDMEIIGEIEEAVEDILKSRCFGVCHPFYCDDNIPCYQSDDCGNEDCPFRNKVQGGTQ